MIAQRVREHIAGVEARTLPWMAGATRPLFVPAGDSVDHVGSCVLACIGPASFALTAGHVLDEVAADSALYVGTPEGTVELDGARFKIGRAHV